MSFSELNNIKSNLSTAYIRAIVSKLNYTISDSPRELDGIGNDCTIWKSGIGNKNKITSQSDNIRIQVKSFSTSSKTMYRLDDNKIEYNLKKDLPPLSAAFYLVVVQFPDESILDDWVEITDNELIMKGRAYYLNVKEVLKKGFVEIPATNILNLKTLPGMFIPFTNKEQYL